MTMIRTRRAFKRAIAVLAVLLTLSVGLNVLLFIKLERAEKADGNQNIQQTETPQESAAMTDGQTAEPEKTEEPTPAPTIKPTEKPTPTVAPTPTAEPTPTIEPTTEVTPSPTPKKRRTTPKPEATQTPSSGWVYPSNVPGTEGE